MMTMDSLLSSPRLARLQEELEAGKSCALDGFWDEIARVGTPLVEQLPDSDTHVLVTFLWKDAGDTRNAVVFNGPASRIKSLRNQLQPLPDTNIWYKTYKARADMRTWYSLSHNDPLDFDFVTDWGKREEETFRADPLNPRRFAPYGENTSILELPLAPAQIWLEERPDVPKGQVEEHRFASQILDNERSLWVYTPPDYDKRAEPYPLLLLLDGQVYLHELAASITFDNLIHAGKVAPFVAVFVESLGPTRLQELCCSQNFLDFLTQEIVPWMHLRYSVTASPSKTVLGGFSAGGLAAAFAGLNASEHFGNILSQSGAFWAGPTWEEWEDGESSNAEWFSQQCVQMHWQPVRWYLEAGLLEYSDNPFINIIAANRHLRNVLIAKGYEVHYSEFNGGHDLLCWRGGLANGLIALAQIALAKPPMSAE